MWGRSIFYAAMGMLLAVIAFWAAWDVYLITVGTAGRPFSILFGTAGWPLTEFCQVLDLRFADFMKSFERSSCAVSLGLYIIAACGFLLAFMSRKNVNILPHPVAPSSLLWRFSSLIRLFAIIAGSVCLIILLVRVSHGQGRARDFITWMVAIVCFGMVIAERREGRSAPFLSRGEWIGLAILSVVFALFYMWHATWWLYSSIGDEYAFLGVAMNIVSGAKADPFSPIGVYGDHTWMVSFSQAGIMKIFGENNFGWRASSALFAVLCFIPFYYFMKYYFSKTSAVIGTAVMACSHYLTTWARIGKPHNNANVFFCLTFGIYVYFKRSPSRIRAYLCGALIGLGFYFFHPAKFCLLLILVLYLGDLFRERVLRRWEYAVSFIIGLLIVAAPLLCHPRIYEIRKVFQNIFLRLIETGHLKALHGSMSASIARFMGKNIFQTLISPFYFTRSNHFLYKNYMDPMSAALFALGLCWSIVWAFRRRQAAALIITFFLALLMTAGLSKYDHPVPTRVLLLFPWWAAFAGVGAWRLLELGYSCSTQRRFWWVFSGVIIVLIAALNIYQLYDVVPNNYVSITPEMLILREAQSVPNKYHIYFIADKNAKYAWRVPRLMGRYEYDSRFHQIYNEGLFNGDLWTMLIKPALVIVDNKNSEERRIFEEIRKQLPRVVIREITDPRKKLSMKIFYLDTKTDWISAAPIKFVDSHELRSIVHYNFYGVVDLAGFPDGTMVVVSTTRMGNYGAVISDDGKDTELWPCPEEYAINWRSVRLLSEKQGRVWVVSVQGRSSVIGLLNVNGEILWSKSLGRYCLGCGTCAEDDDLLIASLKGDRMWQVDPEGKIQERFCVDMPARELSINAMAVGSDGCIYLVDEASKKILVLNKDLVFQGEFDFPVPLGKEVRLIAGEDDFLYLGTRNTLSAIDLKGGKSDGGWTVRLDDFCIVGLTPLGKKRIALCDLSHRPEWHPMIWIAELKPVEQDSVIVSPDAQESSKDAVPVTVVPSS